MCYAFSKKKKNLYEGKIEQMWSEDFHQNLHFCKSMFSLLLSFIL